VKESGWVHSNVRVYSPTKFDFQTNSQSAAPRLLRKDKGVGGARTKQTKSGELMTRLR
jgi:hypothetical protein